MVNIPGLEKSEELDNENDKISALPPQKQRKRIQPKLVGYLINSVTLRAPLLGQDKAHSAGNGKPFPRSATQYWHSSGAHYGSAEDYQIYQADH